MIPGAEAFVVGLGLRRAPFEGGAIDGGQQLSEEKGIVSRVVV